MSETSYVCVSEKLQELPELKPREPRMPNHPQWAEYQQSAAYLTKYWHEITSLINEMFRLFAAEPELKTKYPHFREVISNAFKAERTDNFRKNALLIYTLGNHFLKFTKESVNNVYAENLLMHARRVVNITYSE
jgi:hypothetical protein